MMLTLKNDANRSGGLAVDVCNNVNIENDVNMSGGVLVDVCSDVNGENDVNMSGGVLIDVCSDINVCRGERGRMDHRMKERKSQISAIVLIRQIFMRSSSHE